MRGIEHCDGQGVKSARPVALIDGLGQRRFWVIGQSCDEAANEGHSG